MGKLAQGRAKRVTDLATRTESELTSALKDLDQEFLNNLKNAGSFEAALDLAVQRIAEARDETERTAIALAVFGESGAGAVKLAQEFNTLQKEYDDLGGPVSPEALARLEDAKDRLTDFNVVMEANTLPLVATLTDSIINFRDNLVTVFQGTSFQGSGLESELNRLLTLERELREELRELLDQPLDIDAGPIRDPRVERVEEIRNLLRDLIPQVREMEGALSQSLVTFDEVTVSAQKLGPAFSSARAEAEGLAGQARDLAAALQEASFNEGRRQALEDSLRQSEQQLQLVGATAVEQDRLNLLWEDEARLRADQVRTATELRTETGKLAQLQLTLVEAQALSNQEGASAAQRDEINRRIEALREQLRLQQEVVAAAQAGAVAAGRAHDRRFGWNPPSDRDE